MVIAMLRDVYEALYGELYVTTTSIRKFTNDIQTRALTIEPVGLWLSFDIQLIAAQSGDIFLLKFEGELFLCRQFRAQINRSNSYEWRTRISEGNWEGKNN